MQLSTSKDARYTFEVRTASERNAIVFQAMDQKDCLRWIDAITYGVEQSISSQSAVAAALSNHDQEKETLAMTPETFLLQATQKKTLDISRNTISTVPIEVKESNMFLVFDFIVVKGSDIESTVNFIIRKSKRKKKNRGGREGELGGGELGKVVEAAKKREESGKKGDANMDANVDANANADVDVDVDVDVEWVEMRSLLIKCDGESRQGKMALQEPCHIELVFDNTSSMLRSRQCFIKLQLVSSDTMNAALAASRDDFARLEKETQQHQEDMEKLAESILSSNTVVKFFKTKNGKNFACADCNAPNPDWISINLGICICIKCSGVHRSLGSHISKVRSMHLDVFDEHLVGVVNLVGNTQARKIWECQGTDAWKGRVKHLNGAAVDVLDVDVEVARKDSFVGGKEMEQARRDWIEAKYVKQMFLAQSTTRRFSDASVLTLAGIVTRMAVDQKWENLLKCLRAAESGERNYGGDNGGEAGVDLMAVSPWTILYNIRDNQKK